MLDVLDHVTENDKLLAVANEGIKIATNIGDESVRSFLLGKKSFFLLSDLFSMIYRQKNLKLSSRVFDWIGFSLERDKEEYETIEMERLVLEEEIRTTLAAVIDKAERGIDHEFRGHQFSTIGDAYSTKYLIDKLDSQEGGKLKSKIGNLYFVRRWNLDRYLYGKDIRRKIDTSRDECIRYFERSIEEFKLADEKSLQAHTIYNLAAKMMLFNRFRRASRLLAEARALAESLNEKRLLDKIEISATLGGIRSSVEPGSCFSRYVRRMIIEDQLDRGAVGRNGLVLLRGLSYDHEWSPHTRMSIFVSLSIL
jgi:hypothetical protein